MFARFDFDETGQDKEWRCYSVFDRMQSKDACITFDGNLTSKNCVMAIPQKGSFCSKNVEMRKIIWSLLMSGVDVR